MPDHAPPAASADQQRSQTADARQGDTVITAFYDAHCPYCRAAARWGKRFDWLARVRWLAFQSDTAARLLPAHIDRHNPTQMLVRTAEGEYLAGYQALRHLAGRFPLTMPLYPLMWVWPFTALGPHAYRLIAQHRPRCQPDDACRLR